MANNNIAPALEKPARRVSVTISVMIADIDQLAAIDLANRIQDIAEEAGARVLASYGNPTPNPFGG